MAALEETPPEPQQTWDAKSYGESFAFVPQLGIPLVELLQPKEGERILDLGCGDGNLSLKLVEQGCQVVGVDSSPEMVKVAASAGLDARVVDGHKLPFYREFDAVFSNAALHWMSHDPPSVVAGIAQALKPGGRFVAEFGGFGNVAAVKVAILAVLGKRGIDGAIRIPWYFPSEAEYRNILLNHGFEVLSIEIIPRPTVLPGSGGMRGWFQMFCNPFFVDMDKGEREGAEAEAEELLRHALYDGYSMQWKLDYVRLRVLARLTN